LPEERIETGIPQKPRRFHHLHDNPSVEPKLFVCIQLQYRRNTSAGFSFSHHHTRLKNTLPFVVELWDKDWMTHCHTYPTLIPGLFNFALFSCPNYPLSPSDDAP